MHESEVAAAGAAERDDGGRPARRWGRLVRGGALLAGLSVVGYLLYRVGPETVWNSVRTLGWRLPIVLCFPYALTTTLDTLAWRFALLPRPAPFAAMWGARVAGEAVNATTPTASVGGEPVKAFLLRRWLPLPDGLASVVMDKTTIVIGQGVFLVLGLVMATVFVPTSERLMKAMIILLVIETVCVGGFVLVQLFGIAGRGGRLLARVGLTPGRDRLAKLDGLDRSLVGFYRERPKHLAAAVLFHFLAYATGSLEIFLVLNFLGIPVSLTTALVMESFGTAVKFASFMLPASLGALEGGNMAIFSAFGLGSGVGLSYTLIRRVREATWALVGLTAFAILSRWQAPPATAP